MCVCVRVRVRVRVSTQLFIAPKPCKSVNDFLAANCNARPKHPHHYASATPRTPTTACMSSESIVRMDILETAEHPMGPLEGQYRHLQGCNACLP